MIMTRDYIYAADVIEPAKFKQHIKTLCGALNISAIPVKLNDIHIDAMILVQLPWQRKSEMGTLTITANNNTLVSGIRIFRSPRQNVNFNLLTP